MTQAPTSSDPLADILSAHGVTDPSVLLDDVTGTYLTLGKWLGMVNAPAASKRPAHAPVHADLAALAAAAGDGLSTREHYLTSVRLASTDNAELDAIARADAALAGAPNDDCVVAVYDLAAGPVTFDFVYFLTLAEHFRAISGRSGLYVVFVPAPGDGFRHASPRDLYLSRDRKLWRLLNLLAPCAYLLPRCVGTHICDTRESAAELLAKINPERVFPAGFSLAKPSCPYGMAQAVEIGRKDNDLRAFQAPPLSGALMQRWLHDLGQGKPVVTITLRQSDFQPARNSDLQAWRGFAETCVETGFHPVIVPDTEALLQGQATDLGVGTTLMLPALSIGYRMALYEHAFMNMMTNNGPMGVCLFHRTARTQIFKMVVPSVPTCRPEYFIRMGLLPGSQFPFGGQEFVTTWQDDDLESIKRCFFSAVEKILAEPMPVAKAAAG